MRNAIWLGLLCLTGCEAGDYAGWSLSDIDDPLSAFSEHTEVVALGQASLSLDGPGSYVQVAHVQGGYGTKAVIDQTEDRMQILEEVPHARILIWLDTVDLGLWVMHRARGAGVVAGDTSGTFLVFDEDTKVQVLETVGGQRLVAPLSPFEFEGSRIKTEASAWFSSNVIRSSYVVDDHPPPDDVDGGDVWLRAGVTVLDTPGGVPLFAVESPDLWPDMADRTGQFHATWLDVRSGHVLVDLGFKGGRVRGWVPEAQLVFERPHWGSCGGSHGCGGRGFRSTFRNDPTLFLPAGTQLFAEADGAFIGETTEEHDWFLADAQDDWTGIELATPWGGMTAWVMPE